MILTKVHVFISLVLFSCSLDLAESVNMALNKVIYTSNLLQGNMTILADNNKQTCYALTGDKSYIVMDLGLNVIVSSVVVWSNDVSKLATFYVIEIEDWRTCYTDSFFTSYNQNCGVLETFNTYAILNTTSGCTGRFIALANYNSNSASVCDIEINGIQQNPGEIAKYQNAYERQCGVNNNPYLNIDLALGKSSESSTLEEPGNVLASATDGYEEFNNNCFTAYGYNNYFVLDLESEVNISFIRIQNTYWDKPDIALYQTEITNNWQQCFTNTFSQCNGIIIQDSPEDIWELKTNGNCIGRFFIMQALDPSVYQWLKICEIEVYGTVTRNIMPLETTIENRCDLIPIDQNVAYKKSAYSIYNNNLVSITDGILMQDDAYITCFYTSADDGNYLVLDLGAVYQIDAIKVWNSLNGDGADFTIDVGVGLEYQLQYTNRDITNFQIIATGLTTKNSFSFIKINQTDNIVAQFILIQKPLNYLNTLIVCEIEVLGTLVTNMTPTNKRPPIINQDIPHISKSDFSIMPLLRNGASYVYYMAYSAPVLSVDSSNEGILWIPSSILPIAVAGQYGSGKFAAFGKANYFQTSINTQFDPIFKQNLYTWLSPSYGVNARIIYSTNINSSMSGDIVYFDIDNPLSSYEQQKLLNDVNTGKVSVIIEMTYWAEVYYGSHRPNYEFLLEALHIDFSENWLDDSEQQISISDDDYVNNNYLNIIQQLNFISQNEDYLQEHGLNVALFISNLKTYMITTELMVAMKAIVDKYQNLVTYISPGIITPMQKGEDEMLILVYNYIINNQAMAQYNIKAPGVDIFPGDFPASTVVNTVTTTLNIQSQNENEIHSTGIYLTAGSTLNYTTNTLEGQWMISIGCHTDELFYEPDNPNYVWRRFPIVHSGYYYIDNGKGTIYSPFGGVVLIRNIDLPGSINITISGVIQSPFFNIRNPNNHLIWNQRHSAPGFWAEINGQNIIITVPSNQILSYTAAQISEIITLWDGVVSLENILYGSDASYKTRERIVIDTQISLGYGHSGYPIMTIYSWFSNLFDINVINIPYCWGVVHELGHQQQQNYYTFSGSTEVTVNIFSDFIWSFKWDVSLFSGYHEKYNADTMQDIVNYFANGADFNYWLSDNLLAFMIYGQVGYHFGFGLYQKVLTNYTIENPSPADDQAIIDLWISVLSDYSGYSLLPLFDFWGFPISDSVRSNYANKPCFLPNDPISNLVPDQYNAILSQYNNACDSVPSQTWQVVVPDILIVQRPNDITIN